MSAIYLHYLDRELRRSINKNLSGVDLRSITSTIALSTCNILYCGLSLICESCFPDNKLFSLIKLLFGNNQLRTVSQYPSLAEYIESRTVIYSHDATRYPMYFTQKQREKLLSSGVSILIKSKDTTTSLAKTILGKAKSNAYTRLIEEKTPWISVKMVNTIFLKGLESLKNKAVTFSAFSYLMPDNPKLLSNTIKRVISEEYTKHYLEVLDGDIVTGIPGFEYYDYLAKKFPYYDYYLMDALLDSIFIDYKKRKDSEEAIRSLLGLRGSDLHKKMCYEMQKFLDALVIRYLVGRIAPEYNEARNKLIEDIDLLSKRSQKISITKADSFALAIIKLKEYSDDKKNSDPYFRKGYEMAERRHSLGRTRILLVTATDLEDDVIGEMSDKKNLLPSPFRGQRGVYLTFGSIGDFEVFSARSRMGSVGIAGSETTTLDAIDDLSPSYIISTGIGFGRSEKEQSLGDILVSECVRFYEKQRVGTKKIIPRGDRVTASPILLQMSSIGRVLNRKTKIHTGIILSGEKLVDDPTFKSQLWELEPEAIGGDMEGAGVVSACIRRNKPWIVIKGIADWGENKGDKAQPLAATNTFEFIFDLLENVRIPLE